LDDDRARGGDQVRERIPWKRVGVGVHALDGLGNGSDVRDHFVPDESVNVFGDP
jgi:hypothetical protein